MQTEAPSYNGCYIFEVACPQKPLIASASAPVGHGYFLWFRGVSVSKVSVLLFEEVENTLILQ